MSTSGKVKDRRRIGGDVFLATHPPGAPHSFRVDIGHHPPDWKARQAGSLHRAAFPGTAIRVEDDWYEVVDIHSTSGQPRRFYFDLAPFDDASIIRTSFELSPQSCEDLTQRHRDQMARQRQAAVIGLLPIFTGLLPAADQKRLESTYGLSADRGTFVSASVLLTASVVVIAITTARGLGMHFGELHAFTGWLALGSPLAFYLAIESYARLRLAGSSGPLGSLLVVLPLTVLRGLASAARSSSRPEEARDERGLLTARDLVRAAPGKGSDLLVFSQLPKEHWTANVTGIEYQGVTYVLVDRSVIDTDDGPRHRFLLRPPEHEMVYRSYVRYQPEEVREIYKAEQRVKAAMWVETLPILWGFTDQNTQERLARLYKYAPAVFTRRSIWVSLVAGCLLLLRGAGLALQDLMTIGDGLGVFLGIFVLWEAALRRSKNVGGILPGSVFGLLLRPLTRGFLRWE